MNKEEIKELFNKYGVKDLKDKNGQSECYCCKNIKHKYSLTWTSFLYEYKEEYYCYDCLLGILLQQENQQLKDRINQYENPDDLTLFYMWLDEKAKDKIKELRNKNSILMENLMRSKNKYNNDKSKYRRKAKMYRERINKALEYNKKEKEFLEEQGIEKILDHTYEILKTNLDLLKGNKE